MRCAVRPLLAACLLLGLPAGAAARPWSPAHEVAVVNGFGMAPALSPSGDALLAYTDFRPGASRVLAARRVAGRWRRPALLRRSRQELFDPAAAFAGDGSAVVAWLRAVRVDRVQLVEARTLTAGGRPGRVERLSSPAGRALAPELVAGPGGRVIAAWEDANDALLADELHADGTAEAVLRPRQLRYEIAYDRSGTAIALGQAFARGGVRVSVRPAGGAWSEPQTLSGPRTAREATLAVGADGTAAVAWAQSTARGYRVQYAVRPPGGSFGAPVTVEPDGGEARAPAVAVLPDRSVVLAWVAGARLDWALRGDELRLAVAGPGAAPGPARRIAGPRAALVRPPEAFADRSGDVLLTWTERDRLMSLRRAAGGELEAPSVVAVGPVLSHVTANARGDALAAWSRSTGRGRAVIAVSGRRF